VQVVRVDEAGPTGVSFCLRSEGGVHLRERASAPAPCDGQSSSGWKAWVRT
jgi:hypothetical protein